MAMTGARILTVEALLERSAESARVRSNQRRPFPINTHWVNLEDLVSWSTHEDTVVVDVK